MLVACAKERGEEALQNYQSRLENVFQEVDLGKALLFQSVEFKVPALPKAVVKNFAPDSEVGSINLLDFLSLYGCRLQEVVALSNASLGKLAPASQKLISTLKFIELAPECIELLNGKEEKKLAHQLTQVLDQKRSKLEQAIARSVFEGPEYKAFWKMPRALEAYPEADLSGESERAFHKLVLMRGAWLRGNVTKERGAFEQQLFLVSSGDGGAVLKAHVLLLRQIQQLNNVLDSVLASEKICTASRPYSEEVLRNVVQKFFVGDVQEWAAALNKRQYANTEALAALETAFIDVLNDEYLDWAKQRDTLFKETRQAVQKHVEKLQTLLTQEALKAWCLER